MKAIDKLMFRTKHDLVYAEIRRAIINCSFAPGERLWISSMAKRLEISASPIREALKRLISENFVVEKGNGLYVAPLSAQEFLSMLDVRLELEKICIRRVADCISDVDIQRLNDGLEKMKHAIEREDWEAYYIYHRDFHNECFSFCNVPFLVRALIDAWDHHERGIKFFKLTPWRERPDFVAHEKLFKAVASHNADEADNLLEQNRKRAFGLYREQLTDYISRV